MAKEDLNRFRSLLLSDEDFQEKLRKAAAEYTGGKDEKSVFDNLLLPLAQEYGLSASYEEFKEYVSAFTDGTDGELSDDELEQVAGGKDAGGLGVGACLGLGGGVGIGAGAEGGGVCFIAGVGWNSYKCAFVGESETPEGSVSDVFKRKKK